MAFKSELNSAFEQRLIDLCLSTAPVERMSQKDRADALWPMVHGKKEPPGVSAITVPWPRFTTI